MTKKINVAWKRLFCGLGQIRCICIMNADVPMFAGSVLVCEYELLTVPDL